MDLEVKEVAELLNVSESTLHEWITEGKIPAYFLKERFRFNRAEIEDWVMKQKGGNEENEFPDTRKKAGHQQFNLFRAINKGDVFADIISDEKFDIIRTATKRLAFKLKLDPEVLTELITERENAVPTALGYGFGIPHARDFHLPSSHDVVAVVFLEKPIHYGALDGHPVHTLFFLLACDDKRHLSLLAKIAHLISNPAMREALAAKPNKAELLELIQKWEGKLGKGGSAKA